MFQVLDIYNFINAQKIVVTEFMIIVGRKGFQNWDVTMFFTVIDSKKKTFTSHSYHEYV